MGIRKRNVIGSISGKVGNIIIRKRYGKEVVYQKPESVSISYSEKSVSNRRKFAHTVKLARLINSDPLLASAWKQSKLQGVNTYQKILRYNSRFSSAAGITTENVITPPGLEVSNPSITIDENTIYVEASIKQGRASNFIYLYLLTYPSGSADFNPLLVRSVNVKKENEKFKCEYEFNENSSTQNILQYEQILILSFLFVDKAEKVVNYSSSFSVKCNYENEKLVY